jgi:hypothetical protein
VRKYRPNDKYCVIITDNIIGATSKILETAWFYVPLFLFEVTRVKQLGQA